MGKKIIGVISFAAIASAAGWNYQQNKQNVELSDLALENVEALASREGGSTKYKYVIPGSDSSVNYVCSGAGDKSFFLMNLVDNEK